MDRRSSRLSSAQSVKTRGSTRSSLRKRSSSSQNEAEAGITIASAIVEDIVSKALEIIHERYMEDQLIRFVVHCARQALGKVLKIHFYQHNDYTRSFAFWGSDIRPAPSSPDSWALHQVPLSKNLSEEQRLNTLSSIKLEMEQEGGEIVVDEGFDLVSEPSEGLLQDVRDILNEILEVLPIKEELEEAEETESVISAFTMVVEGLQDYNDFKMKPQLSRISAGESILIRLPKIDVPESGNSRRYQSLTDMSQGDEDRLPPIRYLVRANQHFLHQQWYQNEKFIIMHVNCGNLFVTATT